MKLRKEIEITVEKDEIVIVRRSRGPVRTWCAGCAARVNMLQVEDAAAYAGIRPRTIYRWIEAGKLHFAESDKGLVLVCAHSLAASTNEPTHRANRIPELEP
ncbi:MAG: helix-turn-helix domain-containing protein [Candidatus Acidiferrales bacterium]|jgi:excisionase family DNA binding protein